MAATPEALTPETTAPELRDEDIATEFGSHPPIVAAEGPTEAEDDKDQDGSGDADTGDEESRDGAGGGDADTGDEV